MKCVGLQVDTGTRLERPLSIFRCAGALVTNALSAREGADFAAPAVSAIVVRTVDGKLQGTKGLQSVAWYVDSRFDRPWETRVVGTPPIEATFLEADVDNEGDEEFESMTEVPDFAAIRKAMRAGQPVFSNPLVPLVQALRPGLEVPAEVTEFERWLTGHTGPQRELLTAIETTWLSRLRGLTPHARSGAAGLIKRSIKSPKLEAPRDLLLQQLA